MGNGRELRTIALSVVVQLEEWHSQQLHVLRNTKNLFGRARLVSCHE